MVDYSKWDRMDFSDDDEDGNESDPPSSTTKPRVTTLDGPSRITRHADGTIDIIGDSTSTRTASSDVVTTAKQNAAAKKVGTNGASSSTDTKVLSKEKKEDDQFSILTRNGGSFVDSITKSRIYWCQDRQDVTISIEYDPNEILGGKHVRIELKGVLPYANRFCAVGSGGNDSSPMGSLLVSSVKGKDVGGERHTLLKGDLPHFVYASEEDDEKEGETDVDWEIIDRKDPTTPAGNEKKLIQITLHKARPMEGVIIWWSKPFDHCPEVDVSSMPDRQSSRDKNNNNSSSSNNKSGKRISNTKEEEFKKAWDEAHMIFRERMKARNKEGESL